jgi:D-serine deaminase-like pyridoxal phosphate-dependent protein
MRTKQPTLLVDREKAMRNIQKMRLKAESSGVVFRPHFKTHQSVEVGEWYRQAGVSKITVSSVSMARYFATHGWKDITVAFPVNINEMDEIMALASRIRLQVLVESLQVTRILAEKTSVSLGVFIKIDTGYHRTGLLLSQLEEIDAIISAISHAEKLHFKGFLTHAGHTYHAGNEEEIRRIFEESGKQMQFLKERYEVRFPDLILSYGDTPSCSIVENCHVFDEIRPGNFVYYDMMQCHLGACRPEEIAVAVACPVVALHPERSEMVIYGGAVHFSLEFLEADDGSRMYGQLVQLNKDFCWGRPVAAGTIIRLSQEHGIIRLPSEELQKYQPGDWVGILPVHSCLTANLLKEHMQVV